jgi:hypothetical protein
MMTVWFIFIYLKEMIPTSIVNWIRSNNFELMFKEYMHRELFNEAELVSFN